MKTLSIDDLPVRFRHLVRIGEGGCWLFEGNLLGGYARRTIDGRDWALHRYTWSVVNEQEPPANMCMAHRCHTPNCINPDHVRPLTAKGNAHDPGSKTMALRTHCLNGHEFDEANTYMVSTGSRSCRACRRDRMANRRARLRA